MGSKLKEEVRLMDALVTCEVKFGSFTSNIGEHQSETELSHKFITQGKGKKWKLC